ncbi:MAG: hypothetical protein IT431_17685 [Phycisphaerales bacterium]|nr:hypothetical protein [Phycisphaerales bacterium]
MLYAATALWPLAVCLAPTTLGKSKVAPRHLARAAVYSLAWLPVWVAFSTLDTLVRTAGGVISRSGRPPPAWARHLAWEGLDITSRWYAYATIAAFVWLGVYWACALQVGFRMRRGWAVAAGGAAVVMLALYGLMMAWEVTGLIPSSRLVW